MKLPCAVIRDLLPLYAENMVEPDTKDLIGQHLTECPDCRKRFSEIETDPEPPVETIKPLQTLRKEIRKRRWYTAILAALCVFIAVFTYFFHATSMNYILWQDGLIEVVGVETINPGEYYSDDGHLPIDDEVAPVPTVVPASVEQSHEALILKVSSFINGFEEHVVVEDDGTTTVIMQAFSTNQGSNHQTQSYYESTYYPVPDRLIYGFEQPQKLLWGTPMDGGTEVLPRLALGYYLLIAAALAGLFGLLWGIFRKWDYSWILRQLFFAPVSYILSHLLLKGIRTTSHFMEHDFLSILLMALVVYALLSIAWQIFLNRKKEA